MTINNKKICCVFPRLWPEGKVYHCWAVVRALSCHLLEYHWPCSLPRLWVRGRKEQGAGGYTYNNECFSTERPMRKAAALRKEHTAENSLPFLKLQTDGKPSLRRRAGRPKDHCQVKRRLVQICFLAIFSFTVSANEKAKGEVLPWLPSTHQDSAAPSHNPSSPT